MCDTPGLYASDVHRVAEVVGVLGFCEPGGLAGGFAGETALGFGAVVLTRLVAMVGVKKLFAIQALTQSGLCHRSLLDWVGKISHTGHMRALRRSLKKTEDDPKKTR